ncbi:MAG: Dabb family protein [Cellulosilyticaceae bacterium]
MVRHIVMWNVKDEFTVEEKVEKLAKMKADLEALKDVIPGIIELELITTPIEGSTADMMLNSLFETAEVLQEYQVHPEHKKVGAFVATIACNRTCMDYEEKC